MQISGGNDLFAVGNHGIQFEVDGAGLGIAAGHSGPLEILLDAAISNADRFASIDLRGNGDRREENKGYTAAAASEKEARAHIWVIGVYAPACRNGDLPIETTHLLSKLPGPVKKISIFEHAFKKNAGQVPLARIR